MQIGTKGLNLIKQFEGLRLTAYKCPAGIWTVGYGHTGPDVVPHQTVTLEHAEELLIRDLRVFEDAVEDSVTVELTQNQFDALVSLAFNIGRGAFRSSTLVRLLNTEQYEEAANQFEVWCRAKGNILPGLLRRRRAEKELFNEKL